MLRTLTRTTSRRTTARTTVRTTPRSTISRENTKRSIPLINTTIRSFTPPTAEREPANTTAKTTEESTVVGNFTLRKLKPEDSQAVAQIIHDAFNYFAKSISAPPEFHSVEEALAFPYYALSMPTYQTVVVIDNSSNNIIGCGFMRVLDGVGCLGPVCVTPNLQAKGTGKIIMTYLSDLAIKMGIDRRFTQNSQNIKSLGLYIDLGFQIKEPFLCFVGKFKGKENSDSKYDITEMKMEEIPEIDVIHKRIVGVTRAEDIGMSIHANGLPMSTVKPLVVRKKNGNGKIVGALTGLSIFACGVAEDEEIAKALIIYASSRDEYPDQLPKFELLPLRNPNLVQWALANGFKLNYQGNIMGTEKFTPMGSGVYFASGGY